MKKKYLIGLIIFVILVFLILFGYYIFICMNNTIPKAEMLEDSEFIINHILEKEKKDDNLETFIATCEISSIDNEKKTEFYLIVLIDTYNVENQSLEHNQSTTKLYKIIYNKRKSH